MNSGEEWIFSSAPQGGLLYKTHLTATVFRDFKDRYQHFSSVSEDPSEHPFVYVDKDGIKLVTDVISDSQKVGNGIFALTVAEDGFMEMLAVYEAG